MVEPKDTSGLTEIDRHAVKLIARLEAENKRLRTGLELILPLAKGYAPPDQSAQAKKTCQSWINAAEEALKESS